MSNVHGLNDYSNSGAGNNQSRRQQLFGSSDNSMSMMGISQNDLQFLSRELANNRIPFINIMSDSPHPL